MARKPAAAAGSDSAKREVDRDAALVEQIRAEMIRAETPQAHLLPNLLALFSTLVFLVAAGVLRLSWGSVGATLLALVVHELGHAIGMRTAGYWDPGLFFYPYQGYGTAGQGQSCDPARRPWLALAGPLANVVAGGILGVAHVLTGRPWLSLVSRACLGVGLISLLPVSPFDGGRFAEPVVLARYPLAEAALRAFLTLLWGAWAWVARSPVFLILALMSFFPLRSAYLSGVVAQQFRREGRTVGEGGVDTSGEPLRAVLAALRSRLASGKQSPDFIIMVAAATWRRMCMRVAEPATARVLVIAYLVAVALSGGLFAYLGAIPPRPG